MTEKPSSNKIKFLIIVASLGYFVDIYDLVLFSVVKAESLLSILPNASELARANTGKMLFNSQMIGMLIGGLLWGVLGDKKGRVKVLFGSILLYSLANFANAFVQDIQTYQIIRVIAGIGLAGELGAGITLVAELMPKEKRGYGTMIIVTFGALGAVVASLVGDKGAFIGTFMSDVFQTKILNWQVAYIVGGSMGFLLLLLRMRTLESGFFSSMQQETHLKKGDLRILFFNKKNAKKYLYCILVGIPIWYIIGLLVMNSKDDFGPLLGLSNVNNGKAVMFAYIGLSVGDLLAGILSQLLKSRKKVVYLYLAFTFILANYFLIFGKGMSLDMYYFFCFLLGTGTGYWAIFVTIAAEQFGTNIRSTAANTVPNFVRGSVYLIVTFFGFLLSYFAKDVSAIIVGICCIGLALFGISQLKETFAKNLNYFEEIS